VFIGGKSSGLFPVFAPFACAGFAGRIGIPFDLRPSAALAFFRFDFSNFRAFVTV
jgi:hypothetical protein